MLFNLFSNKKGITPKEAKENMEKDPSIVLLDVRENYEYAKGHIKGAKLLPLGEIQSKIDKIGITKDTTLYVYCQSGGRSSRACSILEGMGYKKVYNLGGIMSWPYETTK